MIDIHALSTQCQNIPDYSPEAEVAKAVCMARGQMPYDQVVGPFGGFLRWQGVLMEAKLLAALGSA